MLRRITSISLLLCLAAVGWRMAWAATGEEVEVGRAIDGYSRALAARDVKAIMGLWSTSLKILLMGTGPGERWQGPADVQAAHTQIVKGYTKETAKPQWRTVTAVGDTAWAAGETLVTDERNGKTSQFWLNWTAALAKQDGAWRVVQFHYSNLTAPPPGQTKKK